MKTRKYSIFVSLSLISLLSSGCTTYKLWSESTFDEWNEPAENPHLRLFQTEKDFLVVYDEYCGRSDIVRRRAYLLHENQTRIQLRSRPYFVNTNCVDSLRSVPVFVTADLPWTNIFAIAKTNEPAFKLYGIDTNDWDLPVYNDGKGKIERILLTPATVTADLTIVGGLVGIWYWQTRAGTGAPLYWP